MLSCAILDDYQGVALTSADFDSLSRHVSFEVFSDHLDDTQALLARLAPFDIIVAMRERTPFSAERLAGLPRLKLLITTGMRNASIDLAAARKCGVTVCGTEGFSGSTAELAWGLLLSLMRHIPREVENFRRGGPWQLTVGRDLRGQTLGLIGLGALGSKMAAFGRAFGMEVLAWSRNNSPERAAALGATAVSLDDLLRHSDAASIHVTLTDETRGLMNAERIAAMKPGAVLLNTARGPVVDEAALIEALRTGRLAGAGVDVFDREPLPLDHPFRTIDTLLATPHLGYVTQQSYRAYFRGVVENIAAWIAGSPIRILL